MLCHLLNSPDLFTTLVSTSWLSNITPLRYYLGKVKKIAVILDLSIYIHSFKGALRSFGDDILIKGGRDFSFNETQTN